MDEERHLIDELERINRAKDELETQEEALKKKLIECAQEKKVGVLFGTHKTCSIKEYSKVIYPEDKTALVQRMKEKGLYERFAAISYPKLSAAIARNEIDEDIIHMTHKEKAFRVSLMDRGL